MSRQTHHRRRTLTLVVTLGLINIGALIGMLLSEGLWNIVFFLLATSPLLVGVLSYLRQRKPSPQARHSNQA